MERIRLDDENKTITIEIEESNEKERLERYHILVEKIMEIIITEKEMIIIIKMNLIIMKKTMIIIIIN